MLLPRALRTLHDFADRPALFLSDRVLRFVDLADALATLPRATAPVLAHGTPLDLVLATLRAWRDGQPLLPLESPSAASDLDLSPAATSGTAHLKLTPGNDGQPRLIRFSAAQLAADADRLVAAMDLRPEIPQLAVVSLTHSYGFSSLVLPLLLHGIPLQTVDVPFPAVVAAAAKNHDRLVVPAVPSMWRAWQRSGILARLPIHLAISAGAPLALELETAIFESHALKLHNFYGASECGGISFDDSPEPRTDPGDLGSPLLGVEVALDPDQRFLIASSSVALGYHPSRPDEILGEGRFLTPDHGRLVAGRLHLDACGSDHINIAGRKLGPGRVEAAILATGLVTRARVFGLPSADPERVDEIAALVPPGTDLPALRTALAARLERWETPRHWRLEAEEAPYHLPRRDLRQRFRR